jgi:hypothetical protein
MHSKNQKLIKLLTSDDEELRTLGIQTLGGMLNEKNAIYWYITTSRLHIDINTIHVQFAKASLGFSMTPPMENIKNMFEYIQKYTVDNESLFEFMMYHEQCLLVKALEQATYLDSNNINTIYNEYKKYRESKSSSTEQKSIATELN